MKVGEPYVECDLDESNQCSDQIEDKLFNYLGDVFAEHDVYFNLNYTFAENGCLGYNPHGGSSMKNLLR